MKIASSEHVVYINCSDCQNKTKNNLCIQNVLSLQLSCTELVDNSMNNLLSYCGLVDARISASDKDLPVHMGFCFI